MICPKCNDEAEPGAVFCQNCGARLYKLDDTVSASKNMFDKSSGSRKSWNVKVAAMLFVFAALPVIFDISGKVDTGKFILALYATLGVIGSLYLFIALKKAGRAPKRRTANLTLPGNITAEELVYALDGKFNYPYCTGVHCDNSDNGDYCVIGGRYALYIVDLQNMTLTPRVLSGKHGPRWHLVTAETRAICAYLIKFLDRLAPLDTVSAFDVLESAEKKEERFKILGWIFYPCCLCAMITVGVVLLCTQVLYMSNTVTDIALLAVYAVCIALGFCYLSYRRSGIA